MLLRLACLALTNALAMLRLLPMTDRAKDVEILALRHQITVLDRQLHGATVWVPNGVRPGHGTGVDRAAHLPASATGDRRPATGDRRPATGEDALLCCFDWPTSP